MSNEPVATSVSEAVRRLACRDINLDNLVLWGEAYRDEDLSELVDCLLAHPDVVTRVSLSYNLLTDETGAKLAQYLAASSTLEYLNLYHNRLGPATYSAVAQALRVNTSLRELLMLENEAEQSSGIEAMFVEALWINRSRPAGSLWKLFSHVNDFDRLQAAALGLGHASMQSLLLALME